MSNVNSIEKGPVETLPSHPAAMLFPRMDDDHLKELAEDIGKHGQREAIVLIKGQILDGRNRWGACILAGVEPRTREWGSDPGDKGEAVDWVLSKNLHRRQLTAAQRASVAVLVEFAYAELAKEHMLATLKKGDFPAGVKSTPPGKPRDESKRATAQAAKAVGAGVSATKTLKAVKAVAEEVFDLAAEGHLTVAEARTVSEMPKDTRERVVAHVAGGGKLKDLKEKPEPRSTSFIVDDWKTKVSKLSVSKKKEYLHYLKRWVKALETEITEVTQ